MAPPQHPQQRQQRQQPAPGAARAAPGAPTKAARPIGQQAAPAAAARRDLFGAGVAGVGAALEGFGFGHA